MRFAVLFAALLTLCSCQPLPHPFADDVPPPNSPLLAPPDSAGVAVEKVAGAPAPAAGELAADMAKALQDADVPASAVASNRGSYRLSGTATAREAGNGMMGIHVAWEMRDAHGALVGRAESAATLPGAVWREGGPALAALTRPTAPSLAKMITTKTPPPLTGIDPVVAVRVLKGAPGDGGEALTRAMENALRRAAVTLADKPGAKPSLVVQGKVEVAPPADGKQEVKISWSLLRPNGESIGEVHQQNAVPAGSLDSAWGLTAYDIANAAVPGITALIAEMQKVQARS